MTLTQEIAQNLLDYIGELKTYNDLQDTEQITIGYDSSERLAGFKCNDLPFDYEIYGRQAQHYRQSTVAEFAFELLEIINSKSAS